MHKRLDLGICSTGEQNDKTMEELRVKQRTVISRLKMKGNKNMTTFFLAALGLRCRVWAFSSLSVASGGYSSLQCTSFSLRWLLLLQSTGSRRVHFSSCSTRAQ